ncbi:hypothetical protein AB0C07_08470 [Actinoplanes missouriensis]|uniref:NHL domain-containing protein n=1 Tax=Actinoplanes missouriensis TaxID=1866 RepID=UPI0033F5A506
MWYIFVVGERRRVAVAAATILAVLLTASPVSAQPAGTGLRPAAGEGSPGFSGDGGPAAQAELTNPEGAAVTADGTLYIADTGNHRVRAVAPDQTIRTVAGTGEARNETGPLPASAKATEIALGYPSDLALGADGTLFIADMTGVRVYALAPDGSISIRADATMGRGSIDKPMRAPTAVAVARDGTLYVADQSNNRVLAVTPAGAVSVAAEQGIAAPSGLAVDAAGDLWISGGNALHRLRGGQLTPVTTAGTVAAISAGPAGLFTVDPSERVVKLIESGGGVRTLTVLDPQTFQGPAVQLGSGTAPDGSIYLIDVVANRVFAQQVTAGDEAGGDDTSVPVLWLLLLGGVALVVLAVAATWALRRRKPRP